jgi:hypothetical protein
MVTGGNMAILFGTKHIMTMSDVVAIIPAYLQDQPPLLMALQDGENILECCAQSFYFQPFVDFPWAARNRFD